MVLVALFGFLAALLLSWIVQQSATLSSLSMFLYSWLVLMLAGVALHFKKQAEKKKISYGARLGATFVTLLPLITAGSAFRELWPHDQNSLSYGSVL